MNFLYKYIKALILIIAVKMLFASPGVLYAQSVPTNFQDQVVSLGWSEMEGFRFDATGQMYVWEKAGRVWVVDTNGTKLPNPLLNISEEVGGWRDHGLNGFALDPNFRSNGFFYLFYTVDRYHLLYSDSANYVASRDSFYKATIARVTRYTANPATNFTTTIPGSRLVLIGESKKTGIPVLHESHSGGQLVFGTDGSLLISTGDGASYNVTDAGPNGDTYWEWGLKDSIIRAKEHVGSYRSQLVDCLNGKILRIDPATGNGLPTNPFYDAANPRSAQSRVWGLGLRNPFRMCLRPGTGSTDITAGDPGVLYVGDVGWQTWEDLHVVDRPGLNMGWPLYEGLTANTNYQNQTVYNQDAPNPLFGTGGCTQQYFQFKNLLVQETLAVPSWPNPCNATQQIPSTVLKFMHSRPSIDWKHSPAQSRTGIFNGNNAAEINLNAVGSPVPGPNFAGNASVGGVWYTGTKYPFSYQNSYLHADYGQTWIRRFHFNANQKPDSVVNFCDNMGAVVFLEYNPRDQFIYYVKFPSEIHRIRYNGLINNPPTANASQNILYGSSPLQVQFIGSNSTDPENLPLTYLWNFGDGQTSTDPDPVYTFNAPNSSPITYNVTLKVTDNIGQFNTVSLKVYVNNTPPQVNIISFSNGDLFSRSTPTLLPLQAFVTDAEHGPNELFYSWRVRLHHNNHFHYESPDTNRITTAYITPVGCDGESYSYDIELTVTDAAGLATTAVNTIYPACDAPDADFISDVSSVCAQATVSFTNFSTGLPDNIEWFFPGGTPATSTVQNPVVKYSTAGTFDVKLVATNWGGSDTLLMPGYIKVKSNPSASITPAGNDTVCSGSVVHLSANTGTALAYQWLKNGVAVTGATSSSFDAASGGNYKVVVTKTTTGCSKTSAAKKIIYVSLNAGISANGPTTFCAGDSVRLVVQSVQPGYTYQWKRNGVNIAGAVNSYYDAKTSGTYRVLVQESHGCSKTSSSLVVTVNCKTGSDAHSDLMHAGDDYVLIPNPASDQSMLYIRVNNPGWMKIDLLNSLGELVENIAEETIEQAGLLELPVPVRSLPRGLYLVRIVNNHEMKTMKLVINRSE